MVQQVCGVFVCVVVVITIVTLTQIGSLRAVSTILNRWTAKMSKSGDLFLELPLSLSV